MSSDEFSYVDLLFNEGIVVGLFEEEKERVEAEKCHEERHGIEHYLENSIFSFGHFSCQYIGTRSCIPRL